MRLGSRSPEHKCSVHNIWLEKVGEVDGVEQLCCPACLYEDIKEMSKLITEQKIRILKLRKKLMAEEEKLLGDRVDEVLTKMGGKKVARAVEKVTKKPCGCKERKKRMNRWHREQIDRAKQQREAKRRARSKPNRENTE